MNLIGIDNANIKKSLAELKQTLQHLIQWKVGPQGLAIQLKAFLTQQFRPVTNVPGLKILCLWAAMALGTGPQLC